MAANRHDIVRVLDGFNDSNDTEPERTPTYEEYLATSPEVPASIRALTAIESRRTPAYEEYLAKYSDVADARRANADIKWYNNERPAFEVTTVANLSATASDGSQRGLRASRASRVDVSYVPVANSRFLASQIFEALQAKFYEDVINRLDMNSRVIVSMTIPKIVGGVAQIDTDQTHRSTQHIHVSELREPQVGSELSKNAQDFWSQISAYIYDEDRYDRIDGIDIPVGEDTSSARIDQLRMSFITLNQVPKETGVNSLNPRYGSGGTNKTRLLTRFKRALVSLPTDPRGHYCGLACLAYHKESKGSRRNMRTRRSATAEARARTLANELGIPTPMVIDDLHLYTNRYPTIRVVVMTYNNIGESPTPYYVSTYNGGWKETLYLALYDSHYYYIANIEQITRPTAAPRYWCDYCLLSMNNATYFAHKCVAQCCDTCRYVYTDFATRAEHTAGDATTCGSCNETLSYSACLARHKCVKYLCLSCGVRAPMSARGAHKCGQHYCNQCEVYAPHKNDHRCTIMKLQPPNTNNVTTYAYDIESTIDPVTHAHKISIICVRKLRTSDAPDEQVYERTFKRVEDFFRWCRKERAIFYAHNAAAYDAVLLTQWLADSNQHPMPNGMIMNGNKVIRFSLYGSVFLDSFLHVAGSLNSLIGTFGLTNVPDKGFFPYSFYTEKNKNYKGAMPPREYFDRGNTDEFNQWYDSYRDREYDIAQECETYCVNDVRILAAALECYRDAALVHAPGISPLNCPTIASYAMRVYRTLHMPPASITIMNADEHEFTRRALKGGRCGVRVRYHDATTAAHIDVNSMYPSKQESEPMPAGKPEWICFDPPLNVTESQVFLERLTDDAYYLPCFALCEYKLNGTAPDLTHPVLLHRDGLRLTALIESDNLHVDASPELHHAILAGYDIAITRALIQTTREDLFTSYIGLYKGVKENAPNAGQRALAKLMLNSLWGKLSQKVRNDAPRYITSVATWNEMVEKHHRHKNAEPFDLVGEGLDWALTQMFAREDSYTTRTTAPSIACAITTGGRLELLRMLEYFDKRVMYYDTDSIIYRDTAPGDPITSRTFGDWGNELEDGEKITEFIGVAPKVYAYKTDRGNEVMRAKGITSRPSFAALKSLAIDTDLTPSITTESIRFNIRPTGITTHKQSKAIKLGNLV